jgi:hypothetical protein
LLATGAHGSRGDATRGHRCAARPPRHGRSFARSRASQVPMPTPARFRCCRAARPGRCRHVASFALARRSAAHSACARCLTARRRARRRGA